MIRSILFRALFFPVLRRFLFILFFLFALYAFIDYSIHLQEFTKTAVSSEIFFYYLYSFSKRLELLLPLSLLLAMLRSFMVMNEKNELVGFMSCGISLRQIAAPYYLLSILSSLALIFNYQFFSNTARSFIDTLEQKISKHLLETDSYHLIMNKKLSDGTSCLYLKDPLSAYKLLDFYWFESPGSIWHAREVTYERGSFQGVFVDHLIRNHKGYFAKEESFNTYPFYELKGISFKENEPPQSEEYHSISSLFYKASKVGKTAPEILSLLTYRLVICLIPFLIFCSIIPTLSCYTKAKEYYLLFTLFLFGFICFFTLMDAFYILANQGVLHPIPAILGIPTLLAGFFGLQWRRRFA